MSFLINSVERVFQEELANDTDILINQIGRIERAEVNTTISTMKAMSNALEILKVRTKTGEKFKFSRIGIEGGNYYGVPNGKGKVVKNTLDEKSIKIINEKDRTLSTVLNIGIRIIILGAIIVSAASAAGHVLGGIGGKG